MRNGLVPQVAPCIVTHNMALGGAQTAILRMIEAMPAWLRERTTLWCQSNDQPLLEAAIQKHGFSVGAITHETPTDPSCWILSYGNLKGAPERPTSLVLHSWDDEGWRYVSKAYGHMRGLRVAGVSEQVLLRYRDWIEEGGHESAGVLPPPVTQWAACKGATDPNRIVVAWMGRPLESKGLMALPYLLALDSRLVVRAWTGADTMASSFVRRKQQQTLDELTRLADRLGVSERLDLRPLDFDPFAYRHRLEGAHVLLGNSQREGFLMTAAEALSCSVPVVVTRSCGIAEFIREGVNGCLIDWNEDPQKLAKASYSGILRAAKFDAMDCLRSVQTLSLENGYRQTYGQTLAFLAHANLQNEQPRVTVGVRIHKGMPIESLDQAVSSLALQTYRRFKTVLLVDGPWEYGEMLARRYDLPLICTGVEPDITHCSWLHRQAVERCDTEFYKPLDYDDQLLPGYLERAVATLDRSAAHVYGCLLMTLQDGQFSERWWPNKPIESMFSGNSNDNQLPHSSVLMRAEICRAAGNYQERAVGLGADDYNLWNRIHQAGGVFVRDDEVRNVVYRIHEKNSLKVRKARYGAPAIGPRTGKLVAGAAAASMLLAAPGLAPHQSAGAAEFRPLPAQSPTAQPTANSRQEPTPLAARRPTGIVGRWVTSRIDLAKAALRKISQLTGDDGKQIASNSDKKKSASFSSDLPDDALIPPQS
jgi:hypothetical protein